MTGAPSCSRRACGRTASRATRRGRTSRGAQALDLTFPLLSDWNGEAVEAFGVAHEFRGLKGVAERSAFLVDGDGTVRGAWRYDTSELPDFDELLQAAQAL